MQQLYDDVVIHPADIDEKAISGHTFEQRATAIARAKAEKVSTEVTQAVIIAADSFITCDSKIFEKPLSKSEAKKMLQTLSGQWVQEYTGCCIIDQDGGNTYTFCAQPRALFRTLSQYEIERYISRNPVTQWAGGFSPAYDDGVTLIAQLQGSLSGFTHGFPVEWIADQIARIRHEKKQT